MSKLLSAQEAGMTLMERMKYLASQDKKTQMVSQRCSQGALISRVDHDVVLIRFVWRVCTRQKKVGDYWIGDVLNEGGFATYTRPSQSPSNTR